jgi:hypothetical protein
MKVLETARFNGKKQNLAVLLATGMKVVDAAKQLGIGTRTAFNWLSDRSYRVYIDTLTSNILEEAMARLIGHATRAVDAMADLLDNADPAIRLRASVAVLETIARFRQNVEFERRIAALEDRREPQIETIEVGEGDDDPADAFAFVDRF